MATEPVRVLVVADHDDVRAALNHLVADDLGHAVVCEAGGGEEALRCLADGGLDLVLLDMQLPGRSGAEVARAIRAEHPSVRVVALTAASDADSVAEMLAAGADSYLVKTAPPGELRNDLERIFEGQVVLGAEVLPGVVESLAARLRAEHERAESLTALEQAKREFLSLVSDRLATPVTAIGGYSKTLVNEWERLGEDLKREFVTSIDRQCDRLAERLQQILAVARLQAGSLTSLVPFSLDGLAREVVGRLITETDEDGGRIRLEVDDVQVRADRAAAWGVAQTLLDNAMLHTDGAVTVRVREADGFGCLEVIDQGPGMEPERLALHLAEPFLPGDGSDGSAHAGMGLSLYAAARIVELCSGHLRIETAPAGGTTAALLLPLARP